MKGIKITFGRWEAISLLINFLGTQVILGYPRTMAIEAGPAAWLLSLYVTLIVLVLFWIIMRLYRNFEGKDLLDISEYIGGTWLRIIIGLIFAAYLLAFDSIVLREFAEDLKVFALPFSPISFISMFFIAGMLVGAYFGIEALVRVAAIASPVIAVSILLIIIAIASYYDINNIFPILGSGAGELFLKSLPKISIFSSLSMLFFIAPFLKKHNIFKQVGFSAIAISGFFFSAVAFTYFMVFTYPVSTERFIPVYQMARLINYGRFFQRIESVFVLAWAFSGLLYLSGVFFFILHILKKTFKLEYYQPLIFTVAILVFTISLLPSNVILAVEIESRYLRNYIGIVTFIIPLVLLIIGSYKKDKKKKEGLR